MPNFADNFKAVIVTAALKSKSTWMLVPGADRTTNPNRWYATRATSHEVEFPALPGVRLPPTDAVANLFDQFD